MLPAPVAPYAKAVYPFLGSLVMVALQWVATGQYDAAELTTQIVGLVSALLAFLPRNAPKA